MKRRKLLAIALCTSCSAAGGVAAAPQATQNDYGGVGLLQTPSARMAPEGTLSLNFNRTAPYSRYSLSLQPFDWFEGVFRYTSISTRMYGPEELSGDQPAKDKAFDLKLRLWQESRWLPAVAVGGRDIAGTGLFSGEYVVASKRVNDFDFSLGLGWGYLGQRGDIDNPLGWLSDSFRVRPPNDFGQGGKFSTNTYFHGPAALFGGVQWQTPWAPLQLKLEYEGSDYRKEPGGSTVKQDSPFNFGATWAVNDWLDVHAGWERGNTALFGITLHTDVSGRQPETPKLSDPPAERLRRDGERPSAPPDWAEVARRLEQSAGYRVSRIAERERELVIYGEQTRYLHTPIAVGRSARVLDNSAGQDIDWFTVVDSNHGMQLVETSVKRDSFRKLLLEDDDLGPLRRSTEQSSPSPRSEKTLYAAAEEKPLTLGAALGYRQSLGGPDSFLLYQFSANVNAEYRLEPGTWLSGQVSGNLLNNFDQFRYDAPSRLPRVRTDIRQYWTTSEVTMPLLQLSHARRLDDDWYGMIYGGYLESMYAGGGGEVLWRPLHQDWALGLDLNWVKQRDFAQDFGLRDYDVLTGHLTGYYRPFRDVLATVSVGRYLAGDSGVTFDLAREFDNGVRFGAWATFTNVSSEDFGEGSFDKGIYVTIPFDLMTTASTRSRADIRLAPLTRDGGARLYREFQLYDLTQARNVDMFNKNFRRIAE